jgi:hypothetical protein
MAGNAKSWTFEAARKLHVTALSFNMKENGKPPEP